jgi:hypothetical protein
MGRILKAEGREVSLREMSRILAEKHGITVTHVTIRSDYAAIGKVSTMIPLTSMKNLTPVRANKMGDRATSS